MRTPSQAQRFLAAGRPIVLDPAPAASTLRFPVVIKPVSGYGKFVTRRLVDQHSLDQFIQDYKALRAGLSHTDRRLVSEEMIVEEYVQGPMFSVELGVDEHGTYPFMVTERRRPDHNPVLEIGSTMPTGAPRHIKEGLAAYANDVIQALGLDIGIFHLEIIYGSDGPVLVEANARLIGGTLPMLYNRSTGESIYDHLLAIHAGRTMEWHPKRASRYATVRQVAPTAVGRARSGVDPSSLRARCRGLHGQPFE
jgi:biotin carboxylase